ncbi:MAG: hypothetical protein AB4426_26920 [Xenococcaceae cyanobacterium]
MNLKILATAICLTPLYLATGAGAQQLSNSPSESLTELSSISQFERLLNRQLQQQSPLFYLFLIELEQYQLRQPPDLQQQAEEELRKILQRPQPFQQRLIQQQWSCCQVEPR